MPNVGPLEIGIVLVIVLIIFGPKKLPDLGHSLGKGIREFKGSIGGEDRDEEPAAVAVAPAAEPAPREHTAAPAGEHRRA